MYLSKIVFGSSNDKNNGDMRSSIAEDYLGSLLKNGQIYDDYYFAQCKGNIVAYTHIARPTSLSKQHHSQWGLSCLLAVEEAFGHLPQCDIIQDNVPKRFSSWKKSSSLYLFTHAFDKVSPVCCGDTGNTIPLYLLPISDQQREYLYFWAYHYKDFDNIWLASDALEIQAYKQTADPKSELSLTGRELCRDIEDATGKQTFYYLHRYWGRNVGEESRLCPVCGRRWRTSKQESENLPFHHFSFRCIPCRLVSHLAVSYDDERHAVIGEYPRQKRSTTKTGT